MSRLSPRLVLENARLQAQIRAQLEDVRASRSRIVAAQDTARRQIERDLHDGAKQHLLAIGLALQTLRRQAGLDGSTELLGEADADLANA